MRRSLLTMEDQAVAIAIWEFLNGRNGWLLMAIWIILIALNSALSEPTSKPPHCKTEESGMNGTGWVVLSLRGDLPPELFSMRNTVIALVVGVILTAVGLWRRKE